MLASSGGLGCCCESHGLSEAQGDMTGGMDAVLVAGGLKRAGGRPPQPMLLQDERVSLAQIWQARHMTGSFVRIHVRVRAPSCMETPWHVDQACIDAANGPK